MFDQPFSYDGTTFKTADSVPLEHWRWPNFTPAELACKGTGKVMIDERSLDLLQSLRTMLGKPIYVNSAYRSPKHNKAVGGASQSQHKLARAYDVDMKNHDPSNFESMARGAGFTGFGFYPPKPNGGHNFIHVDTGPAREWGQRWLPEGPPIPTAPEPLEAAPKTSPKKRRRRRKFGG